MLSARERAAAILAVAAARRVPLARLVDEVAAARPRPGSLASALRTFALEQAWHQRRQEPEPERRQSRVLDEVA
jgi:predicted DNA-binding ribbon-helix-helix protein